MLGTNSPQASRQRADWGRSVWVGTGCTLALIAACGPKIERFDVEPLRMCVGESVIVAYAVRGVPQLAVSRRGGPPADTTTYTLTATRRGKVAFASKDVIAFWPDGGTELAFDAQLAGLDSIASAETLSADRWSTSLRLLSASSLSGRAIRVTHGGRTVILPADGSASQGVGGLSVAGPWELRAPILPGETVGDSAHAPPTALSLRIRLCGTGGPTT